MTLATIHRTPGYEALRRAGAAERKRIVARQIAYVGEVMRAAGTPRRNGWPKDDDLLDAYRRLHAKGGANA